MTKFLMVEIDSEKYFDVRKSKFQTNFSEGKADFRCNFKPCICDKMIEIFQESCGLLKNLIICNTRDRVSHIVHWTNALICFSKVMWMSFHYNTNYNDPHITWFDHLKCPTPFSQTHLDESLKWMNALYSLGTLFEYSILIYNS